MLSALRGYALLGSRYHLIQRLMVNGWKVVLATAEDDECRRLRDVGAELETVPFRRGGFSPLQDFVAYRRLVRIYRKWRPAVVQHYHAKPVIYGSLAARKTLRRSVRVVNTITGLGQAFVSGGVSSGLAGLGYSVACRTADVVVFQNSDDRRLFLEKNWLDPQRARLIAGSGVDLDRFPLVDRRGRRNDQPATVVMLGRLLRQKGIPEFVEVAGRIRKSRPGARFIVCGEEDPHHPDAVSKEWLRAQDSVTYCGRLADVGPLLEEADIFLYPSCYREGVPRVVLEAAAMALPVVAFDVPGVCDAVRHGETGYLAPARDVQALTGWVEELLADRGSRLEMGLSGRRLVEEEFDMRHVDEQYLELYRHPGADLR